MITLTIITILISLWVDYRVYKEGLSDFLENSVLHALLVILLLPLQVVLGGSLLFYLCITYLP